MPSTSYVDLLQGQNGMTPRLNGMGTPRTQRSVRGGKNVSLLTQLLKIAHQRVNLDIDLAQNRIDGFTELTVVPTSNTLRYIKLDCREMKIKDIYLNNKRLGNYIYNDHLYINDDSIFEQSIENNVINIFDLYSDELSVHQHHIIRQKLNYILGELNYDPRDPMETFSNGNTEELTVLLPDNIKFELTDVNSLHTPGSDANMTPLHLRTKNTASNEVYAPLQLLIEYECLNPKNGVNFITDKNVDKKLWHAYTINSDYNISTSSWVPCIDNLWERSTWSIEMNIPRTIKDIGKPRIIGTESSRRKRKSIRGGENETVEEEEEDDDEEDEDDENYDLNVCTGDFNNVKETPHSIDLSKKVVSWSIFNPVCAHHVGWALGCFQSVTLTSSIQKSEEEEEVERDLAPFEDMDKENSNSSIAIYCLPEQLELAQNTCIFANKAIEYFLKEFGSFPFSSFAIVFVNGCISDTNNFAGISIVNDKLLYPPDLIEPMFYVTESILESITSQWSGINIVPQTFNDLWCTIGIAKFMAYQFIEELMGMNEYRFKIKQKMNKIIEEDIGKKPLAYQFFRFPISDIDLEFLRLKAPIVLFILDRRMTKTDKSFGLSRVIPKLFLQAMSGDLQNGTLSTLHLQYVCEKVNRNRLDTFFNQWVYGAGVPIFNISQTFNKKRSMIEMSIRQVQVLETKKLHPHANNFVDDAIAYLDDEPSFPIQPVFLGPMTIRVHEADGTPYEHIVDLKEGVVRLDIQYNLKFKRLKKTREEGHEANVNFSKLGDVLTGPEDIKEWELNDWTKQDEEALFNDPFEWIRVDTDFEWIARVNVKQPDYMFGSQLQYDRDVEAQYDAIRYFAEIEKPNTIYCSLLTRTIMDDRYYYGIRISAAQALVSFSRQDNKFIGVDYLIKIYQKLFCYPNSTVPLSNDFSDFSNFFLQKEVPKILSKVRDDDGNVPDNIKRLLLDLVKYNDNSNNEFQDCFYMSDLIQSLTLSAINPNGSHYTLSRDPKLGMGKKFSAVVLDEINRLQKLDEWMPSYQNAIATTCLRQKIVLASHGFLQLSFEDLLYYTLEKYSEEVRIEAFRGLLLLGGLKNADVLKYFCKVCLLSFSSPSFRGKLIAVLIESICIAAIDGTPSTLDDAEFNTLEKLADAGSLVSNQTNMVVVEESSNNEVHTRRDAFARETLNGAIEILRRDYSIGNGLKDLLWELLHTSLISIYERRNIFSVCQILYQAIDSFIVKIPVPSVTFEELKKKIILKNLGQGKVMIKREGRFKIQLTSFKTHSEPAPLKIKLKSEHEATEVVNPEPKLKLKLTTSTLSESKDKKKKAVEAKIVSFDTKNKYKVTFKFKKRKLYPTAFDINSEFEQKKPEEPIVVEPPQLVKTAGTNVTFSFINRRNRDQVKRLMRTLPRPAVPAIKREVEVPRYVKINTRAKTVSISSTPFPEVTEAQVKTEPEETEVEAGGDTQVKQEEMEITEPEGKEVEAEKSAEKSAESAEKDKVETAPEPPSQPKEDKTEAEPEASSQPKETLQPLPVPKLKLNFSRPAKSRTPLSEPEVKIERTASPFSRSNSPFASLPTGNGIKKKKSQVYIHSDKSLTPEDKPEPEAKPAPKPDIKPKPAFKLKLNLSKK